MVCRDCCVICNIWTNSFASFLAPLGQHAVPNKTTKTILKLGTMNAMRPTHALDKLIILNQVRNWTLRSFQLATGTLTPRRT